MYVPVYYVQYMPKGSMTGGGSPFLPFRLLPLLCLALHPPPTPSSLSSPSALPAAPTRPHIDLGMLWHVKSLLLRALCVTMTDKLAA